ncbi:MAG TPA: hypothetical protein VII06_08160 [Chloroflexota bacterium]|jgi:hypothetical protein
MRITAVSIVAGTLVGAVCTAAVVFYVRLTFGAISGRPALLTWAVTTLAGTLLAAWWESRRGHAE